MPNAERYFQIEKNKEITDSRIRQAHPDAFAA